jgi:hypothetical protein
LHNYLVYKLFVLNIEVWKYTKSMKITKKTNIFTFRFCKYFFSFVLLDFLKIEQIETGYNYKKINRWQIILTHFLYVFNWNN